MTVHVCGAICGEQLEEVVRRTDGEERWCFSCHARRRFEYVVLAPVELSYYEPTPSIECGTCGRVDGDLFPGHYREWSEDYAEHA